MSRRLIPSIALVAVGLTAQTPPATGPSTPTSESIIEQIKKCVVFVTGSFTRNGSRSQMMGTGFLVSLPEPRLGPSRVFYLVTNKHVIREPGPDGKLGEGPYFRSVSLRINLNRAKPDGTQYETIPVPVVTDSGTLDWFIDRNDETVDVAVTPISISGDADYMSIPADLFATEEVLTNRHIDENDEILFAGLFAWNPGAKKNYPIVRHGKLARRFQERIPLDRTNPARTTAVHLADVMSFGGNSGSPVFLRTGNALQGYSYLLLGVMQAFFPEGVAVSVEVAEKHGIAAQNSGIAAIVPVDKVAAIIDGPRGKAYRERILGYNLFQHNDFKQAEKCFRDAIALLETTSPQIEDLAVALRQYAALLRKTNRAVEAAELESRATKILNNEKIDLMNPLM